MDKTLNEIKSALTDMHVALTIMHEQLDGSVDVTDMSLWELGKVEERLSAAKTSIDSIPSNDGCHSERPAH